MPLLPPSFLPFWMDRDGPAAPPARRQRYALCLFLGVCAIAAFYSSLYAPSPSGSWGWYPRLTKPSWAPSPALTGRIATLSYFVLAVAAWRIWRTGGFRSVPFTMLGFCALLSLQAVWSTLFYGMQSPFLGMADLAVLVPLSAVLWLTYQPLDAWAGRLWLSYLGWLLFLFPFNAAIWWLNG